MRANLQGKDKNDPHPSASRNALPCPIRYAEPGWKVHDGMGRKGGGEKGGGKRRGGAHVHIGIQDKATL